jgi:predicted ATPase
MESRVISGNTFGPNTIIVQGNLTSSKPLLTVNNATHADGLRREREIEILKRLYKSPYEDRKYRNPDRARGTCEWFVSHKLFQEWQESEWSTTLWVSADPGCGKSVLAKHLVDSVLPSTASRTTCYFFFKDDFKDQKNIISALCCILHQLFKQKRVLLSKAILDEFEIHRKEITSSFRRLWNVLLSVAKDENAGEIVCLLDAIDECEDPGRSQLARALQTL